MLTQLFELSWKDSNPHRRNQNPTCYHYTTRHCVGHFLMTVQRYVFFLYWQKNIDVFLF